MKPNKVQKNLAPTSIRIDPSLRKEVGHLCVDLDISQTAAIEAGLRLWVADQKGLRVQQTIDNKFLHQKNTVRGIDEMEFAGRQLMEVEEAFSQALRTAGIQIDMLPLVQRIVEDICRRVGEVSGKTHVGQTDPDQQLPFDQGKAQELPHVPDKAERHPTRRTKP